MTGRMSCDMMEEQQVLPQRSPSRIQVVSLSIWINEQRTSHRDECGGKPPRALKSSAGCRSTKCIFCIFYTMYTLEITGAMIPKLKCEKMTSRLRLRSLTLS